MDVKQAVSRRGFVGGVATALGVLGLKPAAPLWALGPRAPWHPAVPPDDYDSLAKLNFNENPYGPSDAVLEAMTHAFKYANRYGYPDGGIVDAIAKHHGVTPDHVMIGSGSGEILDVVGTTFCRDGRKVVGVEPSYSQVYRHATSVSGEAYTIPLAAPDYRQDIPALIHAAHTHYRDVGFIYLCNPNNPTGQVVTKQEVHQLLDGIPEDMPVLIDEAYHHFVEDPQYATSVPLALEGRPVIVTRTFSKIAALAGMRLGYAIAPPDYIRQMRPWSTGTINALVKWGGATALTDTATQAHVKEVTLALRKQTMAGLNAHGYETIPSETNFFMVHLGREVEPVSAEFRKRGVLVGRPFPPMTKHLRVSIGTPDEMDRFMVAFKAIMPAGTKATGGR